MATKVKNIEEVTRALMLQVDEAYKDQLSKSKMQKASIAGTREMINQIRKRTQSGIDVDGKRLKKYSKSYEKFKRDYIKNGVPKKGKRKRSASTKARYRDLEKTTKWRAKKLPAHIRLTGKMFSNMVSMQPVVVFNSYQIATTLRAYIRGKRNQKIYGYLVDMGRDFWGLSTKRARREKEIQAVRQKMLPILGVPKSAIR